MRNIFLIARREYLERVRTRSFIILTFLVPALMLGLTILPTYLATHGSSQSKRLVVVASDKRTAELIQQQLSKAPEEEKSQQPGDPEGFENRFRIGSLNVDVDLDTSDKEQAALVQRVKQKQLDGAIFATKDALAAKKVLFITRDVSSFAVNETIQQRINHAVHRDLLASKGFSEGEIDSALETVDLEPQSPSGTRNPIVLFFAAFSMIMILYMTVFLYGISVMRAIIDEKTSRIMEVMLSIARAKEMMAGKLLGVGSVALTQILIWAVVAGVVVAVPAAEAGMLKGILSIKLLVFFAVYFLLGFALFSTLFAAVGAMVNSEQEAQQLQILVAAPMILSLVFMGSILQAPGGNLAMFASIFPFTAPLIMLLRIAVQAAAPWEIGLSIGLAIATIYGMVLLCARIYRIGILMYGKKPTLPEIMKWIRYA